MARINAMTARMSSCFKILPQGGIMADFDIALPPSVMMFWRYSSLRTFRVAPSFARAGAGFRFDIFDGPAGVELA